MSQKNVAVCIIVENLPLPFGRRTWQEAYTLAQAGYRVSVICPKGRGFEKSRETIDGIEIYRHSIWEASGPFGYFFEYAWALAAEFRLALKVYRRTRFRILHATNPPDLLFLIALFFKLFGVRYIFDHHDLNPELFEDKFGKRGLLYRIVCLAERLTYRTATVSIATNKSYREIAIRRGGMPPERVFIVRSCPDLKNIHPQPPNPALKEGKAFLVVYVGVMGPQDGLDLLLESIEYILRTAKRDDIMFAIVGSGTELPRLKEMAADKGLGSHVRFTGRVPDEELAAYLSSADLGVAPDPKNTMNDISTMNKILEYMAYSRPQVLYDLVEGRCSAEDAALYAQPNDPVDFAKKILTLIDSEQLRRTLGARGRKRIEQLLNWDIEARELLKMYEAALKGKK